MWYPVEKSFYGRAGEDEKIELYYGKIDIVTITIITFLGTLGICSKRMQLNYGKISKLYGIAPPFRPVHGTAVYYWAPMCTRTGIFEN